MNADNKYTHIQFASLMERINDFISLAVSEQPSETLKFKSLMLIVETHSLANKFSQDRAIRLADYFENIPLRDCLDCIRNIDEQKKKIIRRLFPLLSVTDRRGSDTDFSEHDYNLYSIEVENDSSVLNDVIFPDISSSLLWNAKKPRKMGHTFYPTFENLNSDANAKFGNDYNVQYAQEDLKQHLITNYDVRLLNETKGLNITEYLERIRNIVSDVTNQQIYNELMRVLEQLRVSFMEYAHDIYCVRTGDYSVNSDKENVATLDLCYTELPLKKYYEEREERREDVAYELTQEIFDDWRFRNHITNRELCNEEYIRFLTERKEQIEHTMQEQFQELWKLREHSGGYNVDVNSENFARMFYGRRGIDRRFFELQWEYEYIDELIIAKKAEDAPNAKIEQWSPEELAIKTFVEKLTILITECYKQYNGKQCTPGVHQPEVTIEIKKESLIDFLHQQMSNDKKPLKKYCFPTTSKSKFQFCIYVVELIDKGYFGKLPKKELAQVLAPIVGLGLGTVTNYLSKN